MTDVNVLLSVERKLEKALVDSSYAGHDLERKAAYQLGYCESMLTHVLHQVCARFGEDAMLKLMGDITVSPVYSK